MPPNWYIRPGVVWFGEMLPEGAWSAGLTAAKECDVFLSIGTSWIVYPVAELPLRALGSGATVVHINPVRFDISSQEHFLQGPASVMVQSQLDEAFVLIEAWQPEEIPSFSATLQPHQQNRATPRR